MREVYEKKDGEGVSVRYAVVIICFFVIVISQTLITSNFFPGAVMVFFLFLGAFIYVAHLAFVSIGKVVKKDRFVLIGKNILKHFNSSWGLPILSVLLVLLASFFAVGDDNYYIVNGRVISLDKPDYSIVGVRIYKKDPLERIIIVNKEYRFEQFCFRRIGDVEDVRIVPKIKLRDNPEMVLWWAAEERYVGVKVLVSFFEVAVMYNDKLRIFGESTFRKDVANKLKEHGVLGDLEFKRISWKGKKKEGGSD